MHDMRCTNCGSINAATSRFCVVCGEYLLVQTAPAPGPEASNLESEVKRLREDLQRVTETLAEHGIQVPEPEYSPETAEAATGRVAAPTPVTEQSPYSRPPFQTPAYVPPPVPGSEPRLSGRTPEPAAATGGDGGNYRPQEPPFPSWSLPDINWEPIIGGNWLARVGALAVIIGVAFFLGLAFENNWITETGRVFLGLGAGAAFLGAGEYWRKRYTTYAQGLSGTGIAILYLSVFASFSLYDLTNIYAASGALLAISALSTFLAVRGDSLSLALIGIAGAFLGPFILGGFGDSSTVDPGESVSTTGNAISLLIYIFVVDIGVIALSTLRNWWWFRSVAFFGSLVTFGLWSNEFLNRTSPFLESHGSANANLIGLAGITSIFLSFIAATTLFHFMRKQSPERLDISLMLMNAIFYVGISYGLLWEDFRAWVGGFTMAVAALYAGLGYVSFRRFGLSAIDFKNPSRDLLLTSILLGMAVVLITIAIPVQIDGSWIPVVWAAEGTLLIWLSFQQRMPEFRYTAILVLISSAGWLLLGETPFAFDEDVRPFWNQYLPTYLLVIAGFWVSAWLVRRYKDQLHLNERDLFSILAASGLVFLAVGTPIQVPEDWCPLAWAVEGVILFWVAFRIKDVLFRYGSLLVYGLGATQVALGMTPELFEESHTPFWNQHFPLFIALIAGAFIAAYITHRYKSQLAKEEGFLPGTLTLIGLFFIALGTPTQMGPEWWAFAWSIEGLVVTWILIRLKQPLIAPAGLVFFFAAAIRALGLDSVVGSDGYTVIWNSRLLAFAPLILGMGAAGLIWRQQIQAVKQVDSALLSAGLLVSANFAALWFLSAEVIGAVQADALFVTSSSNEGDVISLGLTLLWGVYGGLVLAAGFIGGWRAVRAGGLMLLAIPVFKLFLIDSFQLEQGYRVAAFLILGSILLAGGYFYQRHAELIKDLFIRSGDNPRVRQTQ